ncbi:MAG TPA: TonB-dependent receptor [Opitutaceae bacterium]|nr:TonB-dependent receptor [Opitutaceae bacterium]
MSALPSRVRRARKSLPAMACRTSLILAALLAGNLLHAQTVVLAPEVVTAERTPQPPEQVAFSLRSLGGDVLRSAPTVTVDDALRSVPGFNLFRRSDSLTANPTAQGVSLRGLGPSGASRSLVLLDGVPLNDPFGGWVTWAMLPRESLDRAELVPGGGATAWGNASLGGVVQLLTDPVTGERTRTAGTFGDFSTRSAEFEVTRPVGNGSFQLLGDDFATSGFSLVAPERRGPIDVAAWSRHRWLAGRWRQPIGANLEATLSARTFQEFRDNGTPYQRNGTRQNLFSFALAGQAGPAFAWNATAYRQDGSYASTFSSVNATRTAETPASNQFAVPATADGAAWTGVWTGADGSRTSVGADVRYVRGETRENFTFVSGAFTKLRIAGGDQAFGGIFALREQPLRPDLRLTVGARVDDWKEGDGHRRESDVATGAVSRDDHYSDRDGHEFSPSVGLVWQPASAWRVRLAGQHAFRVPTLNELYRPFRQGTTVVETNPNLRTEHVTSGELGVDWSRGPVTLGGTGFWNDLHNEVANVTIARGPGTFPIFGTLAAGGLGQQRLNLDRTRVRGLDLSAKWKAGEQLSLTADWLYDDATVLRADVSPALVGRRLPQVARNSAAFGAIWRAPGDITVTPRLRWIGRQFEDNENTLVLGETVVGDIALSRPLSKHVDLFLSVENVGNARIETGRSADGTVNTGTPRLALGGLRGSW